MSLHHELLAIAKALDPTRTACFWPSTLLDDSGRQIHATRCSAHAQCFAVARGVLDLPPGLTASQQYVFVLDRWKQLKEPEAIAAVAAGHLVLAAWLNVGGHSHIAPVLGSDERGLLVSAAGAQCFLVCTVAESFGVHVPQFFTPYP